MGQKVLIWTLKRFSHLSCDLKGCSRMNIEKVYIEQEPITYGLLFWGISNDMFKIPRKSLEFLSLLLLFRFYRKLCWRQTWEEVKAWETDRMILQGLGEGLGTKGVCIDTSSQNPARTAKSPSVRAIGAWKISKTSRAFASLIVRIWDPRASRVIFNVGSKYRKMFFRLITRVGNREKNILF